MPHLFTLALFMLLVSHCQHEGAHEKRDAQAAQQPALAAAAIAAPQESDRPAFDGPPRQVSSSDAPQAVRIASGPPRDMSDWIAYGSNLLLATVGIGGVGIAVCTLYKIERQTKATEVAARATRKSADIAANSQRAWLSTDVQFVAKLHDYAGQGLPEVSCMIVTINNSGNSPAEISRAKIIALLSPLELPSEPFYDELEVAAIGGTIIAPGGKSVATVRVRHHKLLTAEEIEQVFSRERDLVCYGRIEYTDNSGRKRVTQFGYQLYTRTSPEDDRPTAMYRAFGKAYNFSV